MVEGTARGSPPRAYSSRLGMPLSFGSALGPAMFTLLALAPKCRALPAVVAKVMRTPRVKFCVAAGAMPLLAAILSANGAPATPGGVPVSAPVFGFRLAHAGSPVALKVGAGVPVATTVKLLVRPALNVVPLALVICGVTAPTVSRADGAGGTPWRARLRWSCNALELIAIHSDGGRRRHGQGVAVGRWRRNRRRHRG